MPVAFPEIRFIIVKISLKRVSKQTVKPNHNGHFEFSVTQYLLKVDVSHNLVVIDSTNNVSSAASLSSLTLLTALTTLTDLLEECALFNFQYVFKNILYTHTHT